MSKNNDAETQSVDQAVSDWCQGDCFIERQPFVFRGPLAKGHAGEAEGDHSATNIEMEVAGLVVVSQTCDIVKSFEKWPFVEVCPLVEIGKFVLGESQADEELMDEIKKNRRPSLAFLPGVADQNLVVDLDRVMTVEKTMLIRWARTSGCNDDDDSKRMFSLALARKRSRMAFPDDFGRIMKRLEKRIKDKHNRQSPEGEAFTCLREIRVTALPSWAHSGDIEIKFWFIRDKEKLSELEMEGKAVNLRQFVDTWMTMVVPDGRYKKIEHELTSLAGMTAEQYVYSDLLDLDYLST